jgi:aspartate/methionine/tyrosine aminotransferase
VVPSKLRTFHARASVQSEDLSLSISSKIFSFAGEILVFVSRHRPNSNLSWTSQEVGGNDNLSLDKIEGSPALEIVNLVLQKRALGEKIISLAVGDPSFSTPKGIINAAYNSMLAGDVHYTSSYGTPEVREAIKSKVRRRNRIEAEIENTIFITTKLSVYAALVAVAALPSFDVLVPDPGYFYSDPILLAGGNPIFYRLKENDFSLDLESIERRATENTKAIMVNSPSNPTSKVLTKEELEPLYDFCERRGIYIISDEAYEDLTYGRKHVAAGSIETSGPKKVISLFSLSKSYSMTGWRAGYVVASREMIHRINKFIENTVTCFPPFIEKASAFALNEGDQYIEEFKKEYELRKERIESKIKQIDALKLNSIEGAFYAFPSFSADGTPSRSLVKAMLLQEGVAALPGSVFGPSGENHIRLSFSGSTAEIDEGMERISRFFSKRKRK